MIDVLLYFIPVDLLLTMHQIVDVHSERKTRGSFDSLADLLTDLPAGPARSGNRYRGVLARRIVESNRITGVCAELHAIRTRLEVMPPDVRHEVAAELVGRGTLRPAGSAQK